LKTLKQIKTESNHPTMEPPSVLLMKRVSVRQFADGRRVALYHIDKLNKYVTIPYGNLAWSGQAPIQAEE
jgi:hypothetical protein